MLDPSYLLTVGDELANRFFEVETEILIDIAKRIKASNLTMSSTAQYQIMKLQQLGLQTEYINQMLAQLLGVSDQVVAEIMNDSAYESIREDMKIYQEADMLDGRTVDLTEQVKVGTKALQGELSNLCQTTVQTANKRYMDLLDKAYLNVSSGLLSSQQAVDQAVNELAKDGLQMVDYKSGAHRQLDSAVRVAVRTATTKNACACQEQVMDDLDVNLVEVSSHMGARPSHAKWQGKIYWRKKKYGNYKNFEDATRYGHGDGLGGWNCRHQFYPYIPGVSEKTYEPYRLTENKEQYELEQKQRYNERMIREWKRREQIMKAAGLDSTYEGSKVKEWQKKNKALIDAHSDILKRDYGREKAYLAKSKSKNQMHYKLNNQLFGRNPKDYDSIKLGKKEYPRVVSQLNTNLTKSQMKPGSIVKKAIGNYIYTFEVLEFDSYRFIGKKRINGTIHDEMDKD
ncbi:hypothetical protein QUW03_07830 [Faecalicoccus acidiformans]|uniref:phage minor capsid protein n=1 Tax=Faecalicoccus acidiformans TaxID=915173 RepID=UPI0025A49897|nr:phage minor capsid protein [Faecalicoccus acidiformans]MDM8204277.1 hypothetical protein [Faecalicoccus acidiformans]